MDEESIASLLEAETALARTPQSPGGLLSGDATRRSVAGFLASADKLSASKRKLNLKASPSKARYDSAYDSEQSSAEPESDGSEAWEP